MKAGIPNALAALLLATAACSFDQGGVPGTDGGANTADAASFDAAVSIDAGSPDAPVSIDAATPDAMLPDAMPDANLPDAVPPDAMCTDTVVTPSNFSACDVPAPTSSLHVTGWPWEINTTTGILVDHNGTPISVATNIVTQTSGPEILIVSVSSLQIDSDAGLYVYGSRPLALVVTGDATLDPFIGGQNRPGLLFAGATGDSSGPGGGILSDCIDGEGWNGTLQSTPGDTGGSGGSGGGFGENGGTGGPVNGSGGSVTMPGTTEGNNTITPLRGGCRGGDGGNTGGLGGGGGGAIQLVVGGTLTVHGTITARGGGGRGATGMDQGGGGGGSGGAILIEATNLTISSGADITANGGGGGEGTACGSSCGAQFAGLNGQNGRMYSETAALGGFNGTDGSNSAGGDGGNGGVRTIGATNGAQGSLQASGGGGGGGAVGRIHFNITNLPSIDLSATISPAEQ